MGLMWMSAAEGVVGIGMPSLLSLSPLLLLSVLVKSLRTRDLRYERAASDLYSSTSTVRRSASSLMTRLKSACSARRGRSFASSPNGDSSSSETSSNETKSTLATTLAVSTDATDCDCEAIRSGSVNTKYLTEMRVGGVTEMRVGGYRDEEGGSSEIQIQDHNLKDEQDNKNSRYISPPPFSPLH